MAKQIPRDLRSQQSFRDFCSYRSRRGLATPTMSATSRQDWEPLWQLFEAGWQACNSHDGACQM